MWTIEPLSLSVEDALITSAYLKELSTRAENLSVAVQSLFGRCCCVTALPGSRNQAHSLAEEAGAMSRRILAHPHSESLNLDPLLLIETYDILSEKGAENADLRRVLASIASGLLAQSAGTQQFGRVRRIAARLTTAGFDVRPAKPAKATAHLLASPEKWFRASNQELAEIADHITARQEALDTCSTRILSLLALAELRNYRVDLGCTLLRAAFQFGEPCIESVEALNFIALQRRRDGRYGFPNQYAESAEPAGDPHVTLYLPLTVNAVWLFRIAARQQSGLHAAAGAE
jgi:hypothetical protein